MICVEERVAFDDVAGAACVGLSGTVKLLDQLEKISRALRAAL